MKIQTVYIISLILVFSGLHSAFAASVAEEYNLTNDKKVVDLLTFEAAEEDDNMLENWMTDLASWNIYTFEPADEAENVLENWMTDVAYWNVFAFMQASESEPEIEDWMTDPFAWDFHPFIATRETEPEIEQWMIDIDSWIINSSQNSMRDLKRFLSVRKTC